MCCFSFLLQPSWINVDFDNWRDWEHEEDEGREEFDRYAEVSQVSESLNADINSRVLCIVICNFVISKGVL